MYSKKNVKYHRNRRYKQLLLAFALMFLIQPCAHAIDAGDWVFHAVGGWNPNLRVVQERFQLGHSFFDDFSVGPVVEHSTFFTTYAGGITWHLEPVEVTGNAGILYWKKGYVQRKDFEFSVHADYLYQLMTHLQLLASVGINLPEKYFRGVPLGLGARCWF